jgi:hypothetical protein
VFPKVLCEDHFWSARTKTYSCCKKSKIIPKIYSKTHNLVNRHIAEKSVLTKSVLDKSAKFFTPKICFGTKYQKWIFLVIKKPV